MACTALATSAIRDLLPPNRGIPCAHNRYQALDSSEPPCASSDGPLQCSAAASAASATAAPAATAPLKGDHRPRKQLPQSKTARPKAHCGAIGKRHAGHTATRAAGSNTASRRLLRRLIATMRHLRRGPPTGITLYMAAWQHLRCTPPADTTGDNPPGEPQREHDGRSALNLLR